MVDSLASGASARKGVRVRLPPRAPRRSKVRFAPTFFMSAEEKTSSARSFAPPFQTEPAIAGLAVGGPPCGQLFFVSGRNISFDWLVHHSNINHQTSERQHPVNQDAAVFCFFGSLIQKPRSNRRQEWLLDLSDTSQTLRRCLRLSKRSLLFPFLKSPFPCLGLVLLPAIRPVRP